MKSNRTYNLQPFYFCAVVFLAAALSIAFPLASDSANAQSFHEDFSIWPVDLKINGTVIACSGPAIEPAVARRFMTSGGNDKGKFVVVWLDKASIAIPFQELLDREKDVVKFGNTNKLPTATNTSEYNSFKRSLESATGILLLSSQPLNEEVKNLVIEIRSQLQNRIAEGNVVCGVGPVVDYFGKFQLQPQPDGTTLNSGLNLIPDTIIQSNYSYEISRETLNSAIALRPHCVSIGIPKNTGTVLQGRKLRTYGNGKTTFTITANERQPFRIQHLAQAGRCASPYDQVVDLTAWRRDAIERQLPQFPPAEPPAPMVAGSGTLFIVGGGGMPRGMMREFVELAGGDKARIVYIPCTENDFVSPDQGIIRQWKAMGVASATVLHTKDRNKANSDEEFLKPLSSATGIWFGGGRQWNFVDSYYGTQAHKLMKDVLNRGGAIGGSSAGASVQGNYLARANPVANFDIMAPGYERGLGFLPGVAIDQHFSQRGRQKDMTQLVNRYPQLLGIGIDEGTALKVNGSTAEVQGRGKAFFYDRRQPVIPGQDDFLALENGHKFHLVERKAIKEEAEPTN